MEEHFTKQEAMALIGRTFESLVEFSGVPQGARGKVIAADAGGLGHWDVIIEWDVPREPPSKGTLEVEGERVLVIKTNKSLRDWFTKGEMAQYMREVQGADHERHD